MLFSFFEHSNHDDHKRIIHLPMSTDIKEVNENIPVGRLKFDKMIHISDNLGEAIWDGMC